MLKRVKALEANLILEEKKLKILLKILTGFMGKTKIQPSQRLPVM